MARPRRVDPEDQLTLTEHLDELRSRLVVSVSVLVIVIAVAFWKWEQLLHWLAKPAQAAVAPKPLEFLQTGPTDAFFTAFSLSLDLAILVTLPLLTYQIYAFVIPAFSREHHKRIRGLALMIPVLFVLGVAFGWFLVLPPALDFLLTFGGNNFNVQLRATEYLQFITLLLIAMGVIFEMPAFMYTLAKDADHQCRVHAANVALRRGAAGRRGRRPSRRRPDLVRVRVRTATGAVRLLLPAGQDG